MACGHVVSSTVSSAISTPMPPATTSRTAMPRMIDIGTPRLSDEIDCGGVECDGRLGDGGRSATARGARAGAGPRPWRWPRRRRRVGPGGFVAPDAGAAGLAGIARCRPSPRLGRPDAGRARLAGRRRACARGADPAVAGGVRATHRRGTTGAGPDRPVPVEQELDLEDAVSHDECRARRQRDRRRERTRGVGGERAERPRLRVQGDADGLVTTEPAAERAPRPTNRARRW